MSDKPSMVSSTTTLLSIAASSSWCYVPWPCSVLLSPGVGSEERSNQHVLKQRSKRGAMVPLLEIAWKLPKVAVAGSPYPAWPCINHTDKFFGGSSFFQAASCGFGTCPH